MGALFDLVNVTVTAGGTGTITVGGAVTGFLSFSEIPDGTRVSYAATDGTNREVGTGVKNGSTLTRTLRKSTTGALLNLSTAARIAIVGNAGNFPFVPEPVASGWLAGQASQANRNGFFSTGSAAFHPIVIPSRRTIDRLACLVWDAGTTSAAKLALYKPGSNGYPLAKVAETAATLDTTTAGAKIGALVADPTVEAGVYWGAFTANSNTGNYLMEENLARAIAELGISTSIPASNDFSLMRVTHAVTWAASGEIFPATLSALSVVYNSYEATPSVFARCV
jgi:hypothetical protein